jgi:hypothetical protein
VSRGEKHNQQIVSELEGKRLFAHEWRLRLDRDGIGKSAEWFRHEPSDAEGSAYVVRVPGCWQEHVPELGGGIGWYFTEFELPHKRLDGVYRLKFWAVDYFAEVWVNGDVIGSHEGGHTPFVLNMTDAVADGTNRLTVRVVDPPRRVGPGTPAGTPMSLPGWDTLDPGVADGFVFQQIPAGLQVWQEGFNIGGIWQPVELLESGNPYITDVVVDAQWRDGTARLRIDVSNDAPEAASLTIAAAVAPWLDMEHVVAASSEDATAEPGRSMFEVTLPVDQAHSWSPADPFLYAATIALSVGSQPTHAHSTRFGFRELTVRDGRFYLNGARIFLKGAHHQRTYPLTLAYPPSREFAYSEVRTIKEAGCNFCRMALNPMALPFLDAADELGLLLQQDTPLSEMEDSPDALMRATCEVSELVQRDRNRPSVVMWSIVNEMAPALRIVPELAKVARAHDPTRIVMENAGGTTHYYLPYSAEAVSYLDEHYYPGAPLGEDIFDYCNRRGVAGQLNFHTEFGVAGMQDLDSLLARYGDSPKTYMEDYRGHLMLDEVRRMLFADSEVLRETFGDLDALLEASQTLQAETVQSLAEALRANPVVGGYNYCQMFDSNAFEPDGLVDFWRDKRKKAFAAFRTANQPLLLVVHATPMNVRSGAETSVRVTLVNEEQLEGRLPLTVRVLSPTGGPLVVSEGDVAAKPWVSVLYDDRLRLDGPSGPYVVEAVLGDPSRPIISKTAVCNLFAQEDLSWPSRQVLLFDVSRRLESFCRNRGLAWGLLGPVVEEPAVIVVTPFVALWRSPDDFDVFARVAAAVERGCTAVFLGLPEEGPGLTASDIRPHENLSPLSLGSLVPGGVAKGQYWSVNGDRWGVRAGPYSWGLGEPVAGVPVPDHPIFEGTPHYGLMGAAFGNVAPTHTIETRYRPVKDLGPAVKLCSHGRGQFVFTPMRLLESLERDALAEKLLSNLLRFAASSLPQQLASEDPYTRETRAFQLAGYRDCMQKFGDR